LTNLVPIGRGGDSTVYRAHQTRPDRDVAVKVLDLTAPEDLRRFEREIRITVELGRLHPNVMKVLDTRRFADGRPCLVMDFYEMGSTHDRLQATGPFAVADVVTIGRVICDALGFAHSRGVLHRDVKPQNILILPTSYVLADFGIARPMDAGHTSSLDRLSYRHASPEVLDGLRPEPTDDLWSLGSTLHTLLAGRAPFAADDPADDTALAYLRRVRLGQRRSLPAEVPPALRAVIDRAMNPDRDARYADAEQMLADLRSLDREVDAWAPGGSADGDVAAPPPPGRHAAQDRTAPEGTDGPAPGPPDEDPTEALVAPTEPVAAHHEPLPAVAPTVNDDDLAWAPGSAPSALADPGTAHGTPDDPMASDAAPDTWVADPLAGIAPSIAGSLALSGSASSGAGPAISNSDPGDAAPTGLHPDAPSRSPATAPPAGTDGKPSARVRTSIVLLAVAMLVASAVIAFLILRPSGQPGGTTPQGSGTVSSSPGGEMSSAPTMTGTTVPVAGGQLTIDDPTLRPTLLQVTLDGDQITVTFSATSSDIASVGLVDITHYDIDSRAGNAWALGKPVDPQVGTISAQLPEQDAQDGSIGVVLVGYSADFQRTGLSKVRWIDR